MRRPGSVKSLENFGRQRLSRHFFMRDFLHSEIAAHHGLTNVPDDPALALAAGRALCEHLLDPLVETFGAIAIRSAYRSPEVNALGNARYGSCASNQANHARHIWDRRDANGHMGATACIIIPWFVDAYERGRDFRDLAWWLHDHLPVSELQFFTKRLAFNITWSEAPKGRIHGFMPRNMVLLRAGETPAEPRETRAARYADFPAFRGLKIPDA
ncbi:MAG: hypothetical protein AAF318_06605 [Pseudomonadota bacterium]